MSKYNYIITKIKLIYKKLFGQLSVINSKVEIKGSNTTLDNILIIFPIDEPSFRVALYTFRNFEGNKKTNYFYLINRVHHSHFHLMGEVYNMNYIKSKLTTDDDFNNLFSIDFDMIVDLNKNFNYDLALIINKMKSKFKVGLSKEFADMFYNLQFNLSESDILENGYEKIKSMLS